MFTLWEISRMQVDGPRTTVHGNTTVVCGLWSVDSFFKYNDS